MAASEEELRTLMALGLGGDAAAYETLLRRLAPALAAYFGRRLFDGAEVEDLVQETLMAIHKRRATYDTARPFMPWAYAIARYKLTDHFRRRGGQPGAALDEADAAVAFEDACAARLDVEKLLDALPAKQQDAIRATKLCGLSVVEAAGATGLTPSDVKVSVHRGLKTLAARLRRM